MAIAFISILLPGYFPPLPLIFQIALSLFAISFVCLPPTILLFGVSDANNAPLYSETIWLFPLKAIHMLDDFRFGVFDGEALHSHSFRTLSDTPWSWLPVAFQFMGLVPVVLIDTRIVTPDIVNETILMLMPAHVNKAIFIVGPNGECPVLVEAIMRLAEPIPPVRTVTPDKFAPLLRDIRHDLIFHTHTLK